MDYKLEPPKYGPALASVGIGAVFAWMVYDWIRDPNGWEMIGVKSKLDTLADEVSCLKKEVRS